MELCEADTCTAFRCRCRLRLRTSLRKAKSRKMHALVNFTVADKQLRPLVVQSMYGLWKQEIEADPLPWQKRTAADKAVVFKMFSFVLCCILRGENYPLFMTAYTLVISHR